MANHQSQKHIATKALLLAALLCAGSLAWAGQVAGTIVHLSGPLLAKKADGTVKILAQKSEVEQGDTLVAEKSTYAQLKFIDNSEITLKPGTTFTIEKFAFDAGKPEADSAAFSLVKGGLRSVTGLLGKRNRERFSLKTPSATIGVRGTTFVVEFVEPTPQALASMQSWLLASTAGLGAAPPLVPLPPSGPPPGPSLPPGLYVQVIDGMINVSNSGGTSNFQAGQFGYVRNTLVPPVLIPANPGLKFMPPPAFNVSAVSATAAANAAGAAKAIDCEVR